MLGDVICLGWCIAKYNALSVVLNGTVGVVWAPEWWANHFGKAGLNLATHGSFMLFGGGWRVGRVHRRWSSHPFTIQYVYGGRLEGRRGSCPIDQNKNLF